MNKTVKFDFSVANVFDKKMFHNFALSSTMQLQCNFLSFSVVYFVFQIFFLYKQTLCLEDIIDFVGEENSVVFQ